MSLMKLQQRKQGGTIEPKILQTSIKQNKQTVINPEEEETKEIKEVSKKQMSKGYTLNTDEKPYFKLSVKENNTGTT